MTIKEIELRMAEIKEAVEKRGNEMTQEELTALEAEASKLSEQRSALIESIEKRQAILGKVAAGDGVTIRSFNPEPKTEENPADSPEYRSAWLKHLRNLPLTDVEQRAFSNTTGNGAEVIPTQTANQIITKIREVAPLLNEVTLLHVKGNVRFVVEGVNNAAEIHAENATINAAADTFVNVDLGGFEIVKLVQISATVKSMSIDAFESWLTDMLSNAIARKIVALIVNGTGSGQPKGIDKAATWAAENSVQIAKAASLRAEDVLTLIGLLPSGYDSNAKFLMSKKTLFTDFMPLQDKGKNNLVVQEGRDYFISGYPVILCDDVAYHEAFLGDFKKVVANLPEDIHVNTAYDINTNSQKYSGVALFDSKPALPEAMVKLVKKPS